MKDWKLIVKGHGLDISDSELERIEPALDALEAAFRPLTEQIPIQLDPVIVFRPIREGPR